MTNELQPRYSDIIFYTSPEIVELMVRTMKPQNGYRIYDPTCGSGGFLIKAADYVRSKNGELKGLRLYGQETIWTTWAIATINIMLHGLEGKIVQGDTIRDPKFLKDETSIDTFDMVFANFPFSVENWAGNGTPKKDKKGKAVLNKDGSPQFSYPSKDSYSDKFNRLIYGVPDFSNGDFAFIQHIIASLEKMVKQALFILMVFYLKVNLRKQRKKKDKIVKQMIFISSGGGL